MTGPHAPTAAPPADGSPGRTREQLMAAAVDALTAAAALTRPVLVHDEAATAAAGHQVWVPGADREPDDWAEFVSLALAAAVANTGSIERALAGRPGSWEAERVRALLHSTVGVEEHDLLRHRTEAVHVTVYVDELLGDAGVWAAYDQAQATLDARFADQVPGTEAYEQLVDEVTALQDRLEEQRRTDWAAYGRAVADAVQAQAGTMPDLAVDVVVAVDVDTYRTDRAGSEFLDVGDELLLRAVDVVPLPGGDTDPLTRMMAGS